MAIQPFPRSFGPLGYNPENKEAFLNMGKSYMQSLFRALRPAYPNANFKVRKNEGGIAVSGEIYGEIRLDKQRGILVELTESSLSGNGSNFVLFSQIRRAYPNESNPKYLGQIVSGNYYCDVHDPEAILKDLQKRIEQAKETEVWGESA